jgi:predicted Zn finger-like uncharacterized protein
MPNILTLICPSCQRALRVPEDLLGQWVKCPSCGETFTAPDSADELAPRPRPAPPPEPPPPPRRDDYDRDRGRRGYDDRDDDPGWRSDAADGKVQAIAVMTLIGGIVGCLFAVGWMATCFGFLWPGTYYSLVMGILAIVKGAALLGVNARREAAPQGTAILQIINIVVLDVANLTMGIIILVFLNEPEVRRYYRG